MKRKIENKNYRRLIMLGGILIFSVIIDYGYLKWIPNFIYNDNYTHDNITDYWKGIISIFVAYMSLVSFLQAADKYVFERKSYVEIQRKEAIRRYQDLLKNAIEIFCEKYSNEYESLFAVQIISNIIDMTFMHKKEKGIDTQVEPFQIISLEGALGILKNHLDKVISLEQLDKKMRQDVSLVVDILYGENKYNWNKYTLEEKGFYNFDSGTINLSYFEKVKLQNIKFCNVKFECDNQYTLLRISKYNTFIDCEFNCDLNIYLEEYATVNMKSCKLNGLNLIVDRCKNTDKTKRNGTKNLILEKCTISGYTNLSDGIFQSLKIDDCVFEHSLYMQRVEIDSEIVVNKTVFNNIVDFQSSVIQWKVEFSDVICKDLFYFWDSLLLKKDRIIFNNFYVQNFERGNFTVKIFDDPSEKVSSAKSIEFGDLYDLLWCEEENIYRLQLK